MTAIAIRINGAAAAPGNPVEIGFEVMPAGSGLTFTGSTGIPFEAPAGGINASIVAGAKSIAALHGFPVGDGDNVILIGGVTPIAPVAVATAPTIAHVVMKGSVVDAVFVGSAGDDGPAEAAAQARASQLTTASEANPQEDASHQATWIARAPVNPT